jgi:hypothetical protein
MWTPPALASWSLRTHPPQARRQFVLAALQKRVSDLLQITKLYTVFQVYDTVDDATAALSTSTAA